MAASIQSTNFVADEFTDPKSQSITISAGANLLHVIVLSTEQPTSVVWNTSESLTYVGSPQVVATSLEAYHYYLKNPTATTANVTVDHSTLNANSISIAVISDADISGDPIRGYAGASYPSGHSGPKTVAPTGNVAGDVLLLSNLFTETMAGIAGSGGSTLFTSSPMTSGFQFAAVYDISAATDDTVAITWTGTFASGGITMFAVAIKGGAGGGSPSLPPIGLVRSFARARAANY